MSGLSFLLLAFVLFHATLCSGSGLDPGTHRAAPPAHNDWHGREKTLAGLNVYVSGSSKASKAVIMISDVFGWKTPLFRLISLLILHTQQKLADKVAASGYNVVAPDYFKGDSLTDIADLPAWIIRHPPAGGVEPTNQLVKALKKKGIHSVGLAGFCWGSKVTALAGKHKGHVKAIVQNHPSFAEASDYAKMAVPFAILAAPTDGILQFKGLLRMRRKKMKLYVKIFTQMLHGWTIRYDETDKKAVKWFHQHLEPPEERRL